MGKGKDGLPDRWTDYLPLGKRIPGTRFIAFKVPLKESFEWRLPPNERFSPLDLVTQVRQQQEELGLIIDLTYTTRYYEPAGVSQSAIRHFWPLLVGLSQCTPTSSHPHGRMCQALPATLQYCKILTAGHEVPNKKTISKFKNAVGKFLVENQHNDKLIGVHCTHGLNRTGYLVCRYLIDVEGMDPNWAIELFNRCRGHSIERENYIQDLKGRSGQRNHPAISGHGWFNRHVAPAHHSGAQAVDYRPQKMQQFPEKAPRRPHQNTNLIVCYDHRQSVCGPHHPSPADISRQRWAHPIRPNHEPMQYLPYQQQLPAYGPVFPSHNPQSQRHPGRYKIDRRPNRKPY